MISSPSSCKPRTTAGFTYSGFTKNISKVATSAVLSATTKIVPRKPLAMLAGCGRRSIQRRRRDSLHDWRRRIGLEADIASVRVGRIRPGISGVAEA